MTGAVDFRTLIEPVARRLLGEPNRGLSTKTELRFGNHGSMAVRISGDERGTFYDHEANVGGGTLDFIRHKLNRTDGAALDWLRENHLIDGERPARRIVATYDYHDVAGTLAFQVVRFAPKDFRQRRPDGNGGWTWNLQGIERVPYRLPELLAAPTSMVFIAEGEKDVDALRSLGLVATTNPGGAGKWTALMSKHLRSRNVVLLPDNDEAGEKHVLDIARKLAGTAAGVGIVRLPNLPPKGDVSDWIASGGTADALLNMPVEMANVSPGKGQSAEEPDGGCHPPEFSDDALALAFAERHDGELLYVPAWSTWLRWDSARWVRDDVLHVFDRARTICREAAAKAAAIGGKNAKSLARKIADASTVAAVERLARCDPRHARSADVFDGDPWLLNTPGGVVDLRTGRVVPHRPDLYLTKCTAVSPGDECPLWLAFLRRVTGGDGELHDFLHRVTGYSLTGVTREHALFFGHGTGANGKGTFLNTVTGIFGDYATIAPMETFTASQTDRHPADLAMLRGARLVAAQETEEGRRWAESKVKALTGGDPITARFMRQDFFTFIPQFKLFIAGNHKPGLRGVDEAIRRRLHLIPFTVTIPEAERDADLAEKLKAEWPGILAWGIEGCLHWQRIGLRPPPSVRAATERYLEAEDAIAAWLAERCDVARHFHSESSILFRDWRQWAEQTGEQPGSQKRFSQMIEARGFAPSRLASGRAGFLGLAPKPDPEPDARRWGA